MVFPTRRSQRAVSFTCLQRGELAPEAALPPLQMQACSAGLAGALPQAPATSCLPHS